MNFYDIITRVEQETQTTQHNDLVRQWTNEVVRELSYDLFGNMFLKTGSITLESGVSRYDLPEDFAMLLDVYAADKVSYRINYTNIVRNIVNSVTADGEVDFMLGGMTASAAPVVNYSSTQTATITSTSTSDVAKYVIITSDGGGARKIYTGSMTGTTPVEWNVDSAGTTESVYQIKSVEVLGHLDGTASVTYPPTALVEKTQVNGGFCNSCGYFVVAGGIPSGGTAGSATNSVDVYPLTKDPWGKKFSSYRNIPTANTTYRPSTVAMQGLFYIFGGSPSAAGYSNEFSYLDLADDVWYTTATTASIVPAKQGGQFVKYNSKLYLYGGKNASGNLGELHEYDPSTNVWVALATSGVAHNLPQVCQLDGKIYVISGVGLTSMYIYDIGASAWTTSTIAFPQTRYAGGAVGQDNKIYVWGGLNAGGGVHHCEQIYILNLENNTWSTGTDAPAGRAYFAHGIDRANSVLYMHLGTSTGGVSSSFLTYDIEGDVWAAGPEGDVVIDSGDKDVHLYSKRREIIASPTPGGAATYNVLYIKEIPDLQNDLDIPELPDWFIPAVIYKVCERLFRYVGDLQKAEYYGDKGNQFYDRMNGAENRQQRGKAIMKYDEYLGEY